MAKEKPLALADLDPMDIRALAAEMAIEMIGSQRFTLEISERYVIDVEVNLLRVEDEHTGKVAHMNNILRHMNNSDAAIH